MLSNYLSSVGDLFKLALFAKIKYSSYINKFSIVDLNSISNIPYIIYERSPLSKAKEEVLSCHQPIIYYVLCLAVISMVLVVVNRIINHPRKNFP
jgi:hypothetical protein